MRIQIRIDDETFNYDIPAEAWTWIQSFLVDKARMFRPQPTEPLPRLDPGNSANATTCPACAERNTLTVARDATRYYNVTGFADDATLLESYQHIEDVSDEPQGARLFCSACDAYFDEEAVSAFHA